MLTRLVGIHGKQWGIIASQMENRSSSQVAARWEKCLDPKLTKGPFTAEEDKVIVDYVSKHGPQNWPALSQILYKRSPKQCRERWFNHLDPKVSSNSWSIEEDMIIFENHEKVGGKWSLIAKLLPGRTDNAIKNRWNSSISKRITFDHITGRRTILPDYSKRPRKRSKKERPPPIHTSEAEAARAPQPAPQYPQQFPVHYGNMYQYPYVVKIGAPQQGHIPIQQVSQPSTKEPISIPQPTQISENQHSPLGLFQFQNGIFSPASPFAMHTPSTPASLFTLGSSGAGTPFSPSTLDMNVFK